MSEQIELSFAAPAASLDDFKMPACCERQGVANLDHHIYHADGTNEPRVNRMCLCCGAHWYGHPSSVKQYTRAEWDELQNAAMEADRKEATT